MILSGSSIRDEGLIAPHHSRTIVNGMSYGESYAGYDIRIKQRTVLSGANRFALASSVEKFDMSSAIIGVVHDKSSWARQGLSVFNTVIEPGWSGFLTLELVYHAAGQLIIEAGSPIAQVLFHWIDSPNDEGYQGKYQDQPDKPVEAIFENNRYTRR